MTEHIFDGQPLRFNLDDKQIEALDWLKDRLPLGFCGIHCRPAREVLSWSIDDLSAVSGVTIIAIQRLERGEHLNPITMQALAFAFETEGLMFFPGHPPLRGENCRGSTRDPRSSPDYQLLE